MSEAYIRLGDEATDFLSMIEQAAIISVQDATGKYEQQRTIHEAERQIVEAIRKVAD